MVVHQMDVKLLQHRNLVGGVANACWPPIPTRKGGRRVQEKQFPWSMVSTALSDVSDEHVPWRRSLFAHFHLRNAVAQGRKVAADAMRVGIGELRNAQRDDVSMKR